MIYRVLDIVKLILDDKRLQASQINTPIFILINKTKKQQFPNNIKTWNVNDGITIIMIKTTNQSYINTMTLN